MLTSEEALLRVHEAWQAKSLRHAPAKNTTIVHRLPGAYVFAQGNQGFVIAPTDDKLPAILGYSDNGAFDETQLPPAFYAWLDEISRQGATPRRVGESVSPLLGEIAWTQDAPMNDLCPRYEYSGYNYATYAGCAAIAIGQIMRFHQYPSQGKGTVNYTTDTYNINVTSDLSNHTYDWAHILPNYFYTNPTQQEREEVAKLVYDVAASMQMDFSPGASNTQDFRAAQALIRHFGYDASLELIDHRFYTTTKWADIIRAEIDAHRPVYLSGTNISGNNSMVAGHAFVVDGYDTEGFYHINWGWNGTSNGYYLLTDLTPNDKQGVGGSNNGYAFMQNAIIGIQPDMGGAPAKSSLCLINEQVWTEHDAKGTSINFYISNPTAVDFSGIIALRISDNNGDLMANPMNTALHLNCKAGYSGERGWYVDLSSMSPGCTFELIYQCDGEEEWHVVGSRTGSPHSLISYEASTGNVDLTQNTSELFDLRLANLTTADKLTTGSEATFVAKIKNNSSYEYFAPLYLMVYDSDGSLVGYTDYKLFLVPSQGEADVSFGYTLPADAGDYHFCVSYESLGYNYMYSPMLRELPSSAYDYVFSIEKGGPNGGGGTPGDGTVMTYTMTGEDYGRGNIRHTVTVRFEDGNVYFQGLSAEVPEGWAQATIKDGTATFQTPCYLGEWSRNNSVRKQYLSGADSGTGNMSGLELIYDEESLVFSSFSNNWMLLTNDVSQTSVYNYDHLYRNVRLTPEIPDKATPTFTHIKPSCTPTDLQGRPVRGNIRHGSLLIESGRKLLIK